MVKRNVKKERVHPVILAIVKLKIEALRYRLYKTYRALDKAGTTAGWEYAEQLERESKNKKKG